MGQRTQLYIIEHTAKAFWGDGHSGNKPEKRRVCMYHNQWGYGYRQLFDLLAYVLSNRTTLHETTQEGATTYNKMSFEEDLTQKAPRGNLFDSLNEWRNFVHYGDNNNGIVVCEIFRDNYNNILFGNIQCFRGGEDTATGAEDGEPITIKEFITQYKDNDLKAFKFIKAVLQYYNICEVIETQKVDYTIKGQKTGVYLPNAIQYSEIVGVVAQKEGWLQFHDTASEYLEKEQISLI